jgi:integrase
MFGMNPASVPAVEAYVRHSADCSKADVRDWKRCKCPKWLSWRQDGTTVRQSAKTRSWEKALDAARRLEEKFRLALNGEPTAVQDAVTLEKAIEQYLADKKSQKIGAQWQGKIEHTLQKQLLGWAKLHNVYFLTDLTLQKLQEFRHTWTVADITAAKTQERLRSFFRWCQTLGWIANNPVAQLSRIKVRQKPTDWFTDAQFAKLLDAVYLYDKRDTASPGLSPNAERLQTLLSLMRYSGLAIGDAATLERERLNEDDTLFLYRQKTGVPVFVPLPRDVAESLRNVPPGPKPNSRYFFWSGNGERKSTVADWQRAFYRLVELADIKNSDDTPKRCHLHMLRDTFAVDLLLNGAKLQDVSLLLGHSSIKITEKHYAPFVRERQDHLIEEVRKARAKAEEKRAKVKALGQR